MTVFKAYRIMGGNKMFAFIGNIGPWELVFILVIALIVVGPGKLPEVAKSVGKAVSEFKKVTSGAKKEFEDVMKFDEPSVKSSTLATQEVKGETVTMTENDNTEIGK